MPMKLGPVMSDFIPVQTSYYEIISSIATDILNDYRRNPTDSDTFSKEYALAGIVSGRLNDHFIDKLLTSVSEYWNNFGQGLSSTISIDPRIKSHYCGDLSILDSEDTLLKSLVFSDLVLIICPLMKMKGIIERSGLSGIRRMQLVVKQIINIQYYHNVIMNLGEECIYIIPPTYVINEEMAKLIYTESASSSVKTFNNLYGMRFNNFDEIKSFLNKFSSARESFSAVNHGVLCWEPNISTDSPVDYYDAYMANTGSNVSVFGSPKYKLMDLVYGRRSQAADALSLTTLYNSSPIIDVEASMISLMDYLKLQAIDITEYLNSPQCLPQILIKSAIPNFNPAVNAVKQCRVSKFRSIVCDKLAPEIRGMVSEGVDGYSERVARASKVMESIYTEIKSDYESVKRESKRNALYSAAKIGISGISAVVSYYFPAFAPSAQALAGIVGVSTFFEMSEKLRESRIKIDQLKTNYPIFFFD